ncbi:MAG: cell division protein FtsQ/DivIB [Hyphomonadaceae bacterium]
MPQIKHPEAAKPRTRRRKAAEPVYEPEPEVRVSSVLFGLAMLTAIIVATAAWMGGSLSQIETRFANSVDGAARGMGLSVQQVSVHGLEQSPELMRLVRDAAMIEPGENMFRADPHTIRRRVESTRQVLNVRVHRLWPDQILIIADAAEPTALWTDGKSWAVIDGLGRHMPETDPSDYSHLVKLVGVGGPEAAPDFIRALIAGAPDLAGRIVSARRVENRRWDIAFDTGVTVRLPMDEHIDIALYRLNSLEARVQLLERPVKLVDLRIEGQIYIRSDSTIAAGAA